MRSPSDLPTPRQAEYAERKRAIAACRAQMMSDLADSQWCEQRGNLFTARLFAENVHRLADDLVALYEHWIEDYPPDAPTPFSQVAVT